MTAIFLRHCKDIGIVGFLSGAVTRGDTANVELLQEYGVRYVETDNDPLGAKHNAALELAGVADRYMVLPSDDLVSREWVDACTGYIYGGVRRCALVEMGGGAKVLTNKAGVPAKFGACRVFSREVVEACGGRLWTDSVKRGLDRDSHARVSAAGYVMGVWECERPAFVDVKGPGSLWGFDVWTGDAISPTDALWMCSLDTIKSLTDNVVGR